MVIGDRRLGSGRPDETAGGMGPAPWDKRKNRVAGCDGLNGTSPLNMETLTMTKTLKKTVIYAALVAGLTAGLGGIQASQAGDLPGYQNAPEKTVTYSDLNIATRDGASVLYKRIRNASREVCKQMFPPYSPAGSISYLKCTRELVEHAVRDVNAPALTALYEKSNIQIAER